MRANMLSCDLQGLLKQRFAAELHTQDSAEHLSLLA
jgi:hypothetical protein